MTRKQKNTAKTIIIIFIVLVLGCGVLMAITKGFTDWNPYGWFDKDSITEEKTADFVYDEKGNSLSSNQIYSMPERLSFTTTSKMSTQASSGVTIRASVYPTYATNQNLSWKLVWSPKTTVQTSTYENYIECDNILTSAYVTLTISGKNNEIANLVCKNVFYVGIDLICETTDGSNISQTVTLDYYYNARDNGSTCDGTLEAVDINNNGAGEGCVGANGLYINYNTHYRYDLSFWIWYAWTDDDVVSQQYGTKALFTEIVSYDLVFADEFLTWLNEEKSLSIDEVLMSFSGGNVTRKFTGEELMTAIKNSLNNDENSYYSFLNYLKEYEPVAFRLKIATKTCQGLIYYDYVDLTEYVSIPVQSLSLDKTQVDF